MIYALLTLLITAAFTAALVAFPRWDRAIRWAALAGVLGALGIALWRQGLPTDFAAIERAVEWPRALAWLGPTWYREDAVGTGLGNWTLLLGALALVRVGRGPAGPAQIATVVAVLANVYALAHASNLLAFAGHTLVLTLAIWALGGVDPDSEEGPAVVRQRAALAAGALSAMGLALLVGRATGGQYILDDLSLSAVTVWPLTLAAGFVLFWLGLAPVTGWSAMGHGTRGESTGGMQSAIVQAVALGVPAAALVLRLQALITRDALAGSVPDAWAGFTSALVILGGATTLVAGAGAVVWAGTPRWSALGTAFWVGVVVWGLGLDTSTGRMAALAALLAFGLGRVALEMAAGGPSWLTRMASVFSLSGAPVGAGFVGLWLLTGGLVEARRPALALVVVGAAVLMAAGMMLHVVTSGASQRHAGGAAEAFAAVFGLVMVGTLLVAGAAPVLWLGQVQAMASVAGSGPVPAADWTGLFSGGQYVPLLLLGLGALLIAAVRWLIRLPARSSAAGTSVLLPTAIDRLQRGREGRLPEPLAGRLLSNPPPAVWWLSLAWLEGGLYGTGALLARLGERLGGLMRRLEGRYFVPLALVLTLLAVLAVTR
ncbi:MAG TPA: hypothetical protein VFR15_09070 [Chloroflexia bacterium]|nr:hypothetical protein [Chloroflexia bacterium]